jgi:hypothetical protein
MRGAGDSAVVEAAVQVDGADPQWLRKHSFSYSLCNRSRVKEGSRGMANAYFPSAATILPDWPLTLHGVKDEQMYRGWYNQWYSEHPEQALAVDPRSSGGSDGSVTALAESMSGSLVGSAMVDGVDSSLLTVGLLVNILADREKEWALLPATCKRVVLQSTDSSVVCHLNKCTIKEDGGTDGVAAADTSTSTSTIDAGLPRSTLQGGRRGGTLQGAHQNIVLSFASLAVDMWMVPHGKRSAGIVYSVV